jgi:hypothetical protein
MKAQWTMLLALSLTFAPAAVADRDGTGPAATWGTEKTSVGSCFTWFDCDGDGVDYLLDCDDLDPFIGICGRRFSAG